MTIGTGMNHNIAWSEFRQRKKLSVRVCRETVVHMTCAKTQSVPRGREVPLLCRPCFKGALNLREIYRTLQAMRVNISRISSVSADIPPSTISTVAKNTSLHKPHDYVLQNRSYGNWKFHTAGIGIIDNFCSRDLDPMTNLTRVPWRYTGCEKMNFIRQRFRKLLYYNMTGRKTDRQTWRKLYTT